MPGIDSVASLATSLSLIERVGRNDAAAWQRFCHVYGPLVYRWARLAGLQDSDAADVGQEVFRTIHRRIREFDPQRTGATFRGWLRVITRNKIGDLYRRDDRHPAGVGGTTAWLRGEQLPDALSAPEADDASLDEQRQVLHRTLEVLKGEFETSTWQAFWLTTVTDLPAGEAAHQLGLTPAAVRQAKYRVLRRLRDELGSAAEFA